MSDRIFGFLVVALALGYILSATSIQESFLSDPMGPKAFPYLIGAVCALCGAMMILYPDSDPDWPSLSSLGKLALAVVVLVAYAETLKPFGFLMPTAVAAAMISYLIRPRAMSAVLTGVGLSGGLFVVFKYGLGLGLFALPRDWLG